MKSILVITWKILCFLVFRVRGEREFTLTTAVTRDDFISMKPTTYYRRIAVDRHAGDNPIPSDDIFNQHENLRRHRADSIWNWDYWCQLQPQSGNCTKSRQKYFYNTHLDECSTFTYTGCNGNKNRFDTLLECERQCKGAVHMAMKIVDRETSCSLQPNAGLCVALLEKFYYDVNERTCKRFIYGGCGGNQNRFNTKTKCIKKCEHIRSKKKKVSFEEE